ncbi:MAG: carbohydrate ABC transporter permease [Devosiaceae bacterium]|nr:carbohydrate ABC transporter permease [Devosiaceae bacterium MH13]
MIVVGVTLGLVTGEFAAPPAGAAALAGLLAGAYLGSVGPVSRQTRRAQLIAGALLVVILALATFAAPFGLGLDQAPVAQLVALAIFASLTIVGTALMIGDIPSGAVSRYKREEAFIRVMKGLGYVIFTVMVALPFYVMVMTSLKNQSELLANPLDLSIDLSQGAAGLFSSYYELFTQFNFGRYLLVSFIVSTLTVILTLAFSIPGAYAVARLRFKGRQAFARSILLIYMVPAIVLVIPLYAVFSQLGLRNSLLGLLIVYPATTVPVALYMLKGYFEGLPAELEEAGLMDGLSRFGVIVKITLPLALPAIASVSLYVFMIAWNEFLFAFMFLDDPSIFTLSRGVVSLNSSEVPRQHLMAGAVVATVPVLVVFLWLERFLVAGLTAGSVKG